MAQGMVDLVAMESRGCFSSVPCFVAVERGGMSALGTPERGGWGGGGE